MYMYIYIYIYIYIYTVHTNNYHLVVKFMITIKLETP